MNAFVNISVLLPKDKMLYNVRLSNHRKPVPVGQGCFGLINYRNIGIMECWKVGSKEK
jgi:hypothetical protein